MAHFEDSRAGAGFCSAAILGRDKFGVFAPAVACVGIMTAEAALGVLELDLSISPWSTLGVDSIDDSRNLTRLVMSLLANNLRSIATSISTVEGFAKFRAFGGEDIVGAEAMPEIPKPMTGNTSMTGTPVLSSDGDSRSCGLG